jgi:hypothetical protein
LAIVFDAAHPPEFPASPPPWSNSIRQIRNEIGYSDSFVAPAVRWKARAAAYNTGGLTPAEFAGREKDKPCIE